MRFLATSVVIASTSTGCSSAYDTAFKDATLGAEQRLHYRMDELTRCADHTLRSLDEAAALYEQGERSASQQARLEARLNAAEAGAFQMQRRGLSIQDVARELGRENDPFARSAVNTIAACRANIDAAIRIMRGHGGQSPTSSIERARKDVRTMQDYIAQLTRKS